MATRVIWDIWRNDLSKIQSKHPCWQNSFVKLKLLPKWWPVKWGAAWALFGFIFIASNVLNTNEQTRKYLLAHEYGHIVKNHSLKYLPIGILIISSTIVTMIWYSEWLALVNIFSLMLLYYNSLKVEAKEFEADDVAFALVGKDAVLIGCLTMSELAGSLSSLRRKRLYRMGWNNRQ